MDYLDLSNVNRIKNCERNCNFKLDTTIARDATRYGKSGKIRNPSTCDKKVPQLHPRYF